MMNGPTVQEQKKGAEISLTDVRAMNCWDCVVNRTADPSLDPEYAAAVSQALPCSTALARHVPSGSRTDRENPIFQDNFMRLA